MILYLDNQHVGRIEDYDLIHSIIIANYVILFAGGTDMNLYDGWLTSSTKKTTGCVLV